MRRIEAGYNLIDSDEELLGRIRHWNELCEIAVDMETESNLHMYGEHLALIQVFDGDEFCIIDPLSGVTDSGVVAFMDSEVKKLWFSVEGDAALIRKKYGISIRNAYDIRALSLAIGERGGLDSLVFRFLGKINTEPKKKMQMSNWMKRPLTDLQIRYALDDVADLFSLRDVLEAEVAEKNRSAEAKTLLEKAVSVRNPAPPWTKIPSYNLMGRKERMYLKNLFLARERIAERFNVPPSLVLDKRKLAQIAKNPIIREDEFPPRFRSFLKEGFEEAVRKTEKEIRNEV